MKRVFVVIFTMLVIASVGYYLRVQAGMNPQRPIDHARVTEGLISLHLTQRADGYFLLTVRNDSSVAVSYPGYSEGQPVYNFEVLRGDAWTSEVGWCGVGIAACKLGARMGFAVEVFADSKRFGSTDRIRASMGFSSLPRSDWERVRPLRLVYSNELQPIPRKG